MQNCNRTNEESKRKVVNTRKKGEWRVECHHKRKEAHKTIRNNKMLYIKNVIESIEEDQYIITQRKCIKQ